MNELKFIQTITYGKDIQKGEAVLEDHIVDVHRLELVGADGRPVAVPDDCGVIFLFSIGWRKGLYFNFQPLPGPNGNVSDYSTRFGRVYGQLQFQEKTSLDEQQWKQLSEWGWFPFSCLTKCELRAIGSWSRQNRFPRDVFTRFARTSRLIASRRDVPLCETASEMVVTVMVEGTRRTSRFSTAGRKVGFRSRAGLCR